MATEQAGQPVGMGESAGMESAGAGGQMTGAETKSDKNPIQGYYKWMLAAFLAFPLYIFIIPMLILLAMVLIVFCLGVWALIQAYRRKQVIWENDYIIPALIMPIFLIMAFGMAFSIYTIRYTIDRTGNTMNQFKKIMWQYTEKHEGHWPEPNQWCDVLIKDDKELNASFWAGNPKLPLAMNAEAGKLGRQMPGAMVLLFQSKEDWNQYGGPELAAQQDPFGDVLILYGDGTTQHVNGRDVKYLKWHPADSGIIPKWNKNPWYALIVIIAGAIVIGILVIQKDILKKVWKQSLVMVVIGMGTGAFFGSISIDIYRQSYDKTSLGLVSGMISGLAAGVCFTTILGGRSGRLGRGRSLLGQGTLLGAGLGIFSAAVVHGLLSVYLEAGSLWLLIFGCSFGVYGGTFAGILGSLLMTWWRPKADTGRTS
jgi:hypothetical protein